MAEESKPRKLGRGLSALFGEESESDAEAARKPSRTVAIGQIHPGRYQPRRVFDDEKLAGLVELAVDQGAYLQGGRGRLGRLGWL